MEKRASYYLLLGQLCLFLFLFICFLLIPHFLLESNEGGISNYGVHELTIIPYSIAFGVCAVATILASRTISSVSKIHNELRWALLVLGIMYLLILITTYPYQTNHLFDTVHIYAGVLLILYEMLLGIWFTVRLKHDATNGLIFVCQTFGFILATLTYYGILHILFVSEMLVNTTFAVLLVRSVHQVEE